MTDFNSAFDQTRPFSTDAKTFTLAANTALSYTVPGTSAKKYRADFSFPSSSSVFVGLNVSPTIPGAGTGTAAANIEFLPESRYVVGGDVIYFISTLAVQCGVSLLNLPSQ